MKGYAGSIAIDSAGERIALTSSHGGVVMLFGIDGTPLTLIRRQDAAGVAAGPEGFIVTDGMGVVSRYDGQGLTVLGRMNEAWDNHLVAI